MFFEGYNKEKTKGRQRYHIQTTKGCSRRFDALNFIIWFDLASCVGLGKLVCCQGFSTVLCVWKTLVAGAHRGRKAKSAKVDIPNPVSDLGSDADEVHDSELWNAWESSHIAEPLFIFLNLLHFWFREDQLVEVFNKVKVQVKIQDCLLFVSVLLFVCGLFVVLLVFCLSLIWETKTNCSGAWAVCG